MRIKLWQTLLRIKPIFKAYRIAEHLQLHPSRLSQIAGGTGHPVKSWEIEKICKYFGKDESELFGPLF